MPDQALGEGEWTLRVRRIAETQDRQAFSELFAHFAPRVKAFLMRSGLGEAMAEDCAQEVMATVWHKAALFDPAKASVATWVFTIARNRKIDMLRKQRRPEPEDLPWGPEPEPEQAEVLGRRQESARLGDALARLPEAQRKLVEAAYFGDLSHSEIAAKTGLPLGTIKSRLRLALEKLRHAAEGTENLMPYILEAVRAYATLGEMTDVLREVFGTYQEPTFI